MTDRIAVCSMFRDSEVWHGRQINQVGRFFAQMKAQGVPLKFFLIEGDSTDNTVVALEREGYLAGLDGHEVTLLTHEVGGGRVESSVDEVRFANLSKCGNIALNAAKASGCEYIFWVESDFVIQDSQLINKLIARLSENSDSLAISPVPTYETRNEFYDTFVFKTDEGGAFGPSMEPFSGSSLMNLSAFGSCGLMRASLLVKHDLDFGSRCFMGLCERAHNLGMSIYCDPTLKIYHPSQINIAGRLV